MSDTRFTASNGFYVEDTILRTAEGTPDLNVLSTRAQALIEYGSHKAQAERDVELGRWRSVENPDCVVYPLNTSDVEVRECRVVDERDGEVFEFTRGTTTIEDCMTAAAREFFAAHPLREPKPWEQAQPGELWYLKDRDDTGAYLVVKDDFGNEFIGKSCRFSTKFVGITAGRRIWPEAPHG